MAAQNIVYLQPDKDPAAVLDYTLDLSEWLAESPGDTIASATVTAVYQTNASGTVVGPTTDLVVESSQLSGALFTMWLAAGSDQSRYRLEVTAVTAATAARTDVFIAILNVVSELNLAGP